MSSKTVYVCDICSNEVIYNNTWRVSFSKNYESFTGNRVVNLIDVCSSCVNSDRYSFLFSKLIPKNKGFLSPEDTVKFAGVGMPNSGDTYCSCVNQVREGNDNPDFVRFCSEYYGSEFVALSSCEKCSGKGIIKSAPNK